MITGADIVYISSIEWNFLWQIHQEVAIRFADAGNRVLYIENTGIRSPGIRDVARIGSRLKHWLSALRSSGIKEVAPNVFVCSPVVLPPFGSRFRRQLNRRVFLRSVCRAAKTLGFRDPLLWTYLPTDTAIDIIDLVGTDKSKVIYYCVADFSVLSEDSTRLKSQEAILARQSDLLFAHCQSLVDHLISISDQPAHLFPAGVDIDAFPRFPPKLDSGRTETVSPLLADLRFLDSLRSTGNPLVGYMGGIHRFVDQQLIAEMAALRPDWNWLFIGPSQVPTDAIQDLKNVHLIGSRPHQDLVYYLEKFSACIIPYKNVPETAAVAPVKLKEYLAASKPVVSTRLPAIVDFEAEHNCVLLSDANAASFLSVIEDGIAGNSLELAARRRRVAEMSNWSRQFQAMSELIDDANGIRNKLSSNEPAIAGVR